jgi:hypothetical protein
MLHGGLGGLGKRITESYINSYDVVFESILER